MKKSILGIVAIVVMMAVVMAGCPNPTTDEDPVFSGVLYEDGFSPKLADPKYWNVDETAATDEEGARGFVTGAEKTIVKNGTESFKVDWSAATDWMGLSINVGSGATVSGTVDLSEFTALTFWAKADGSDAEIDEFGFGADGATISDNGPKYKSRIENVAVPTADWKKFIIPLPNPAKLTEVNSLFYAVDGASGDTIYLDDIKFENLSTVAVKTFGYSGTALNVEAAGTANIGDLSAVFTDGTDDISLTFENLAAHVSWESDKSAVATVNDEGQITGVATGTATITGTLGGETVTISVTVAQAVPFTGVLFDDAPQGGFALNKDAGGGADKVTIDPAASVDSQTAIKVTLASDAGDWGGFFFERSSGVDISGKTLEFSVLKASLDTAPITKFGVKLQDTLGVHPAQTHHSEIDLFTSSFTKTDNGNWYDFSIPVAAFNSNDFDATDFNILGFWNPKKDDSGSEVLATGEFVFDDIKFVETTATTYTVTYNANGADGGTLSKVTDTVNDGHTVLAAPTGITRTGHTLKGWNTESNGSGTDFVFGTTPVNGDITLYAQWEMDTAFTGILFDDALQNGFAVDVNSDGDAAIDATETTTVAGTSGKSIKISQSSGNWGGGFVQNTNGVDASSYTKIQFSINVASLDSGVDYLEVKLEDTNTPTAGAYSVNLYALTADSTDGDWNTYSIALSAAAGVDLTKFKSIGFWHPKAGGVNGTFTPGTFYVDDIKFNNEAVAQRTVTYNANGADGGTLSKTTDTVDDGGTISAAPTGITKAGHTLSGWNTEPDGNGHDFVFDATPVTGDITLYAKWTMDVVDTVDNRYYFLGDATGVDTPEMEGSGMTHFGGYDNTITFTTEASGGADSTSGYFKLVGSESQGWAAGGWGDGPYIDFTGYDTLVFWAKVPGTPTAGKIAATQVKFVLTSRHRTSGGDVGGPIITRPDGSNFTTTWTKYEIPLTEITIDANFMQEAIKEFKYEFLGNNHELHLDEVYLRASGNAPALAVTVPEDSSKTIDESPAADTVLENIAKLTTVTAGAALSYSITDQSVAGAMSIDSSTGDLKVATPASFDYATNPQLTATVEVSADDGGTPVTDSITVTIKINNPAVAPTDAPTAPTANAAAVINLFSDTYPATSAATQIDVTNWNTNWGGTTVHSEVTIAGNTVKKYSNLNYHGIEFTENVTGVDVSTKTKVHFDLWTADETSFTFFLITPGPHEHGVAKTPTLNSWNSYDIDLSDYTTGNASLNLADIFQIKIVGSGGKTVFLDNIYFY